MESIKKLKEKKQSISSINKITNAMELISITKSRQAVKRFNEYKNYFSKFEEIIFQTTHDLKFIPAKDIKGTLWIIFTSDLGLAGGYNINIVKELSRNIHENDKIIVIGKKGESLVANKIINKNVDLYLIDDLLRSRKYSEILSKIEVSYFEEKLTSKIIYTHYISQISFEPKIMNLLPIDKNTFSGKKTINSQIEFEPNKQELFIEIINLYIYSVLVNAYHESVASEHTSRRIAMENATTNGKELLRDIEIELNRTRQAKITQKISKIIGGSEA